MFATPRRDTLALLSKVPEITLAFWVIKILATTVGETFADFLNTSLGLGLSATSAVMTLVFLVSLGVQLRYRRYVPWAYWLTVVLISVVGTLVSDNLVDHLGVSLTTNTIAFSAALAVTFVLWQRREGTLSIHSIYTRRRELFYWAAILFTFALGTSAGDLLAEKLALGYALSAVLFAAAIGLVTLLYLGGKLRPIPAFWIAYILTRPLGASCGDFLSQPVANGGMGLGTVITSFIFLGVILALVCWLTVLQRNDPETRAALANRNETSQPGQSAA